MSAKIEENKWIIEVKAKKSKALYYISKYGRCSKGCYIRVGTSCRSMAEEQTEKSYISGLKQKDNLVNIPARWSPITFNQLRICYEGIGFHIDEATIA